jgi:hypothetical protein
MSTREQYKDYVIDLKHELHKQKQELDEKTRLLHIANNETERLKRVCRDNTKEIESLEKVIKKTKKWYQIIIWQK